MKTPILFLALAVSNVFAAPKPQAEGIYVADSSISHAPPRTTFALIEPNGEIWSAVNWYNISAGALHGNISPKTGDGRGVEFSPGSTDFSKPLLPVPLPLRITSVIFEQSIRFNFFIDEPVPGLSYAHHQLHPQGKRGAYDVDLVKQTGGSLSIPTTVLTSSDLTLSILDHKVTGNFGNCFFNGHLSDAQFFKRVTLALQNSCFTGLDGTTLLISGTKLEGVLFAAQAVGAVVPDVYVLVLKTKFSDFGFSRVFTK